MIIKPLLRLLAAAVVVFAPLSPALAGGQKGRGGPIAETTLSVPALGSGALNPLNGAQNLSVNPVQMPGTPVANALPEGARDGSLPLAALPVMPTAQTPLFLQAAKPGEALNETAQTALQPSQALPFSTAVSLPAPQTKVPLLKRAGQIALSLLGLGKSEESAPEGELVPVPVRSRSTTIGSRLKRSTRAFVIGTALTLGMLGNANIALAQGTSAEQQQSHQQAQESRVLRASSVQDMIARWEPSMHVIVIGNLPATAEGHVASLQQDLKGTHVYVLLAGTSQGHSFRSDEGWSRSGDEALEYGLGQGVGGKAIYQALVDGRTGKSDGVLFLLRFPEGGGKGYMAYGPSATQMDAGLSIDRFKANVMGEIGPKLREPQLGVRAGVQHLRTWVDEGVTASVASRQGSATQAIADAKAQLKALETESADFARRHPNTSVAVPSAANLKSAIAEAERLVSSKRWDEAASKASGAAASARSGREALGSFDSNFKSATDELRTAGATIGALESAVARFKDAHRKADGDMTRPAIASMKAGLAAAEAKTSTDPSGAVSAAKAVTREAQSALDVFARFENDGAKLDAIAKQIKDNADLERASAGSVERQQAQSKLDEARERHGRGESSYVQSMNEASASATAADAAVAQADANAARNRFLTILFSLIGLGLFASILTWLALRAKPIARKAREQYAEKSALVKDKLEAVMGKTPDEELGNFDTKVETLVGPADGPNKKDLAGKTAQLADQVREDAAAMSIIWPAMSKVLELAQALIFPKGFARVLSWFKRDPWEKGLKMLKDEPVKFTPEDGIPQLYGQKRDWRDDLYGSVSSQKAFTKTFEELVSEYNMRAKRSADALTLIEQKIFALEPTVQGVQKDANEAKAYKDALAKASTDGQLAAEPIFTVLLPASQAALEKLQADHRRDPVGAIDGSGADAGRMAADAKSLANLVSGLRSGQVALAYEAKAKLSAAGFDTAWIDRAVADLSKRADAAANKAVERSIASELKSLSERADAVARQIASTLDQAERLGKLRLSITAQEAAVVQAREQVANATGAPADKTLREKGKDPTKTLAAATRSGANAEEAISNGKVEDAEAALVEGEKHVAFAASVVAEGLAAIAAQAETVVARIAEHKRIFALQPAREEQLKEIKKRFAASVLSLRAGDPAHPSSDGTIDNNLEEAAEHLSDAQESRKDAETAFSEGRVLDAAELLRVSAGQLALAQHRLDEISEKLSRLNGLVTTNAAFLERMTREIGNRKTTISDDARSQEPTREAVRDLRNELAKAKDLVEETKGDPFAAETQLKAVEAELAQVDVKFRNDVDAYNEVVRSLQAAERQLQAAANEASTARNDGHGDSQAIIQAYNALESLRSAYSRAKTDAGQPHGVWAKVDVEADRITNEAAKVAATLKRETAAAEEASAAISNAASKVREATNWTGRYGVSIPGSPGSDDIDRARRALADGRYDDAKSAAAQAKREASSAISAAEAEVDRRYRAEQAELERQRRERERQEEERRAAARRAEESRRSSSGSGLGGGGFGGGGSRSGMGGGSW